MTLNKIEQLFLDTAYIHTGGSAEELKCANYLKDQCKELGLDAVLEPFAVDMADIEEAILTVDGKEIPCKGYLCAGSSEVEAPFYYLADRDSISMKNCRGKIVMLDGYLGYWVYQDLLENGAVGIITYDGDLFWEENSMDQRELRSYVSQGRKIPGVHINVKDAVELVRADSCTAKIVLKQKEYTGTSHNVVLDMPGEIPEMLVFTAHYDTTALATGAYDNMSGSIALLAIAEYFTQHPHRYGLRFIWCGSEERGLLGSKAYCRDHDEEELKKLVLNINVDMIGSIMGGFIACCTSEEKLVHYIQYLAQEVGFGLNSAHEGVYSSDSTPFADKGIPAVSFARCAPGNTGSVHTTHDTIKLMKTSHMDKDIRFITLFTDRMANSIQCPVAREMPEKMKEELDYYLCRKRKP